MLAVAWEALRFVVVVVILSSSEEDRSEEPAGSEKGSKSLMVSIDRESETETEEVVLGGGGYPCADRRDLWVESHIGTSQ